MVLLPSNFCAADPSRLGTVTIATKLSALAQSLRQLRPCRSPPTGRIGNNWDKPVIPAGPAERQLSPNPAVREQVSRPTAYAQGWWRDVRQLLSAD